MVESTTIHFVSDWAMDRRHFTIGAFSTIAFPALAQVRPAQLRGALDVTQFGVRPDASDDQSVLLQKVLEAASREDKAVMVPPGRYLVSNLALPARTRLVGVAGTARFVYGGGGSFLTGDNAEVVHLEGLTLDGANRALTDEYSGLVHLRQVKRVTLEDCDFFGSTRMGVSLESCGGQVRRNRISGAAGAAGLFSVEALGLTIADNTVQDCANGGILVHRWRGGEDNTQVRGNRVAHIAAKGGGTGQRGNGINIFRAHGVQVSGNHVSDCAFSAIRSNAGSNISITGNTCLRSGETAIYSEFGFEGALIAHNIVDGGAIGISIANFNEGGRLAVCSNNIVRNLKNAAPYPPDVAEFGIGIYAEADTLLSDNIVENAENWGLALGWGPFMRRVHASGNLVQDSRVGLAVTVADGAGSASIENNRFVNTPDGAIVGHRWREAVTGDLVAANTHDHLTIRNNYTR
ncbi:MAG: TIGR03808 family TAT-translocated repetitive protein [Pseudomonadota bacterium]